MHQEYTVIEGDFVNAGKASSSVKKTLKQLNVNPQVVKRVVVALYEAEVNAIAHAYGGKVLVDIDSDKIKMVVADKGPGIPDIALAMHWEDMLGFWKMLRYLKSRFQPKDI